MERIWKLAVYIFWIVASTALILLAYVLSGNQYNVGRGVSMNEQLYFGPQKRC